MVISMVAALAAPAAPAPPSSDLRPALRRLERAANDSDYGQFKAALTAARAAAEAFPPGGERSAANDALAVYADIEKLWDYANNTATGAFFDASTDGGALLAMLNRYPGFGQAIAGSTMETGGTTIYPTREARTFLAAEGARKLAWMGAAPRHALHPAPTTAAPASSPAVPPPSRRRDAARPAGETPALQKPATTTTVAPVPQTPAEKPEAAGGRINLLLALILIVVGLGVLIFLFRASD